MVKMRMMKIIDKIFENLSASKCLHSGVNQFGNTHFCPDCGNKIMLSWYTVRCGNCKSLRMPKRNFFGRIMPLKKFCSICGAKEWYMNKSNVLDITESFYAIAHKEIFDKNSVENDNTSVWVEQEKVGNMFKPGQNIIKAKKRV